MSAAVDSVAGIDDAGQPRSAIPATLLLIMRTFAFVFFSVVALTEILTIIPFVRAERRLAMRSQWLHRWCRFGCCVLGIHLTTRGRVPRSGLVVSNHLGYIDILALSSLAPCIFVAKRDVSAWPLFGWLARAAGTIFVDRRRRLAAGAAVNLINKAIGSGLLVVVFPEGTSSDGATVLPFKSALLEPALQLGCSVTTVAIDYSLPDGGSVADEICYWRDMTLVPHLMKLFAKSIIETKLSLSPFQPCGDRKQIARALRDQIIALRS
jgi:lyso-ornithine lipid O-acyltransferase